MLNIQYGKRRIPIYTFERTGNDGQMYLAKGTSLILLILAFASGASMASKPNVAVPLGTAWRQKIFGIGPEDLDGNKPRSR